MAGRVGVHGHVVGDNDFFLVGLNELGQIGQAAAVEETGRPRGSGIGRRGVRTAGGDGGFCLRGLGLLHGLRGGWPARSEVMGGEGGTWEESNARMKRHKQPMPRAKTTPALEEEPQEQGTGSGRIAGERTTGARRGMSI